VSGKFYTLARERAPGTHWIGSWAASRVNMDIVVKRKEPLSCPCYESNLGCPTHSLVTILTELPRFHFDDTCSKNVHLFI